MDKDDDASLTHVKSQLSLLFYIRGFQSRCVNTVLLYCIITSRVRMISYRTQVKVIERPFNCNLFGEIFHRVIILIIVITNTISNSTLKYQFKFLHENVLI